MQTFRYSLCNVCIGGEIARISNLTMQVSPNMKTGFIIIILQLIKSQDMMWYIFGQSTPSAHPVFGGFLCAHIKIDSKFSVGGEWRKASGNDFDLVHQAICRICKPVGEIRHSRRDSKILHSLISSLSIHQQKQQRPYKGQRSKQELLQLTNK